MTTRYQSRPETYHGSVHATRSTTRPAPIDPRALQMPSAVVHPACGDIPATLVYARTQAAANTEAAKVRARDEARDAGHAMSPTISRESQIQAQATLRAKADRMNAAKRAVRAAKAAESSE